MITFIILLSCLITASLGDDSSSSSYSSDYSDYTSDSSSIEERILGGAYVGPTELKKFKYMVGIFNVQKTTPPGHTCGAVLIHERVVLTAAHCLSDNLYVSVFVGTNVLQTNPDAVGAIKVYPGNIIIHSDYTLQPIRNDIALLILPYPVPIGGDYIDTIPLASNRWTDCSVGPGWVAGWGATANEYNSRILKYAKATPMSTADCRKGYDCLIPHQQLCSSGQEMEGICAGDSGGPYALEYADGSHYLCGINSYILGKVCSNSDPKYYTSVAYFNDNNWICKNSRGLVGCQC